MYFLVKDDRKANFDNFYEWKYPVFFNFPFFETFKGWSPPWRRPCILHLFFFLKHCRIGHLKTRLLPDLKLLQNVMYQSIHS